MSRKKALILLTLGALCIWSLAKACSEWKEGKLTSESVTPFFLIAVVTEQVSANRIDSAGARNLSKAVRIGAFLAALVLLVVTGVKGT